MKITYISVLSLLVGISLAVPHVRRDVDPDDPSASDPKTPPSAIKDPPRPHSIDKNHFIGGSVTVPDSCNNLWNPSQQCLRDLEAQNNDVEAYAGDLKFEDGSCDDEQKLSLEIAAWDALTLANFGGKNPASAREIATWRTYVGPDFSTQQGRIVDNLRRIQDHRPKKKFDIVVSCKDTKNLCGNRIDGKSVGGYAWTQQGWFGYTYQHITLCQVYFGLDSLEEKFEMIEKSLASGDTKYASEAEWQKNKGQFFLHEMMHLDAVGNPHITDEYVQEDKTGPKAYGPRLVYKLAQRNLNQGGGATRASTNADSYAWLANSLYFYDATGYFPMPPKYRNTANIDNISPNDEARAQDIFPVYLGKFKGEAKDEEIKKRFKAELDGMKSSSPTHNESCKDDIECSSPICAGGGAVYSCVEGTCQCGFPKPPPPAPINTPPPGTRCYEDISEPECTKSYEYLQLQTFVCFSNDEFDMKYGSLYIT